MIDINHPNVVKTLTLLCQAKSQQQALGYAQLTALLGFEPEMYELCEDKLVNETEQGFVISGLGIIAESALAKRKVIIK